MNIALIFTGGIIISGINFVLYCCFVVASREEKYLEKIEAAKRDDVGKEEISEMGMRTLCENNVKKLY